MGQAPGLLEESKVGEGVKAKMKMGFNMDSGRRPEVRVRERKKEKNGQSMKRHRREKKAADNVLGKAVEEKSSF